MRVLSRSCHLPHHLLITRGVMSSTLPASSIASDDIFFHKWKIDPSQVFFRSNHCYGLINLKPIVPGHVLVISNRVVSRMSELSSEEVADLFCSVHKISPIIERHYGASALNIAVQDGVSAGQSVPHVHVHILPRKDNDFKRNDDVYEELERHRTEEAIYDADKNFCDSQTQKQIDFKRDRQPRTAADMATESQVLRDLLASGSLDLC